MTELNARAKLDRVPETRVAADFLAKTLGIHATVEVEGRAARIWRRTREHLFLVLVSLALAIAVALPLGIAAGRHPRAGQLVLGVVGVAQTIPSLALLVFMIPLLGIGTPPALLALFLYGLLPIVRNTATGLRAVPADLRDAARALGLPDGAILRLVELPMASPAILAGIKTSAVINVGTATLGGIIGAGGYGQPIITGIRLDDVGLILRGRDPRRRAGVAVPGAVRSDRAGGRATRPAPVATPPRPLQRVEPELVDEAPAPLFARLERAHDRVVGGAEVLGGVAVLRIVAAAHVTAAHAQTQVHPLVAHLQALLAAVSGRTNVALDGAQVFATRLCLCHGRQA